MAKDDKSEAQIVHGRVKWFDPAKGFGFLVPEEGGPDILLHVNVLRNFGQSSVADGAGVQVAAQQTERGVQAVQVFRIDPPPDAGSGVIDELAAGERTGAAQPPLEPARVKWFDKVRGFGFANVFGRAEDVFVHVEVLRMSGLSDLQPGEAVGVRVTEGRRGMLATEVLPWEAALPRSDDAPSE